MRQEGDETEERYAMLSCCGCGRVSLGYQRLWISDGSVDNEYYPSPIMRKEPDWLWWILLSQYGERDEGHVAALLKEVYQAVAGGQRRLAAMGIRAVLEQVMIAKVGDLRTFDDKLDAFQAAGYISAIQRDAMRTTLDVGDAAMHRAFLPSEDELKVALDIVEGVLAPIYGHRNAAEKLADRVPPRPPRPK